MSSTEPTPEEEQAAREKEGIKLIGKTDLAQEQAALPYKWTQTLEFVDVTVPVPPGTKARDLAVSLKTKKISIGLKNKDPILSVSSCIASNAGRPL
jgi:hypothetical protein